MEDIIVIVGPTGVGKTKLSIELAKKIDAEIINGDSVAIYKELNIGSAKPTIEEMDGIPHHLIDIKEVEDNYSVFDYQKDVRRLIEEINSRKKRIIIVGGTGLYIKAALYDYKFTEGTTYNMYEDLTNEEILDKISSYDLYLSSNLEINNRQRLVRILNKLENNEEITNNKDKLLYPIKVIGLTTDRDNLYERINNRVDKMIENGLLNEIKSLKDRYKSSRILNSAIGYKEFYDYLYNSKDLDEVIANIKQNSRRFAKRQYTFFNHQFHTQWFNVNFNNFNNTIDEVYNYIKKETN
ncbi:MAG: tRNA (adenosine(37)-N6)-dimethylallyltransferase MiaA [Bacilli bacterium]|nr:tRNA (adenosine(37)-N6)-dimethylallyltransferase MiaA [Bacilli bacterium]